MAPLTSARQQGQLGCNRKFTNKQSHLVFQRIFVALPGFEEDGGPEREVHTGTAWARSAASMREKHRLCTMATCNARLLLANWTRRCPALPGMLWAITETLGKVGLRREKVMVKIERRGVVIDGPIPQR